MTLRYFSNAPAMTLAAPATNSDLTIQVSSVSSLPLTYPYTLILDRGEATEEIVDVTSGAGTTLTVTRAVDNSTAFAHSSGAAVVAGFSARDLREANTHINTTTGVHGVSGDVVGTTDVQVLTNKDLSDPSNTFNSSLATLTGSQTLTNKTIDVGSNTLNGFDAAGLVATDGTGRMIGITRAAPTGQIVGTSDTQTLTGKTLSVGSNTINGLATSSFALTDGTGKLVSTSKAIPSGTVVGTTDTQTLTNKTLTSPTINSPTINTPTIDTPTITGVGYRKCAVKTADTGRSTTSQTDDPHLTLTVPAAGTYIFTCFLDVDAGGFTGDINVRFTLPSGTITFSGRGPHNTDLTSGTNANGEWIARQNSASTTSSSIPYGAGNSPVGVFLTGTIVVGGSGTFTLQWGQNTASGTTSVLAGSYLTLERVA